MSVCDVVCHLMIVLQVSPHATIVESCVPPAITNVVIDFLHRVSVALGDVS